MQIKEKGKKGEERGEGEEDNDTRVERSVKTDGKQTRKYEPVIRGQMANS